METTSPIPSLVKVAAVASRMLEAATEILQDAEALLPVPSPEEIVAMRRRERPLTPEAYLLGLLWRVALGAENLASDLANVDEEVLRNVQDLDVTALELNAIGEAAAERMVQEGIQQQNQSMD